MVEGYGCYVIVHLEIKRDFENIYLYKQYINI
jgi:hypothetical protein